MRNLKRALSLTLASVMLLGMMVVGAGAAGFPDVTEEDNVEAIEVLQAVEVMVGDDNGNFGPNDLVNRSQMAVVMANLLNLDYKYYEASCPFWDVPTWARPYVGACYANKIVSGYGDGTYGAADSVTAVQAASMMMRALGYFKYDSDYKDGFETATVRQGTRIGIFNGLSAKSNEPLTRNDVARMALNVLQTSVVEPDDNTINIVDGNGNLVASGGQVNYVVIASNESYARAINRTEYVGNGLNQVTGYTVELGEQLYNGSLKLNDDIDPFNRPARAWEYKGKTIGLYAKEELMKFEHVGEVTGKDLYDLLGKTIVEDYTLEVALDGVTDPEIVRAIRGYDGKKESLGAKHNQDYVFDANDINRSNKGSVGDTGTGVLTQVFVDPDYDNGSNRPDGRVWIAVINTYLARANQDYDTRREELAVNTYSVVKRNDEYVKLDKDGSFEQIRLGVEEFPVVENADKDDAFLVTLAEGEVQTIVPAEVMSAVTVSSFKVKDNVVVDGTKYNFTTTAGFDADALKIYTGGSQVNLKDITYNIFLDAYGNLIGVQEVDAVKNYVFIAAVDINDSNLVNGTANAKAVFLDGTVDTIRVNMDKSDLDWYTTTDTPGGYNKNSILNTWCTYTKNNSDVYTVKQVVDVSAKGDAYVPGANNNTGLAQYHQTGFANEYKIDKKHITLQGNNVNYGEFARVYGNEKTVYLTAELGNLTNDGGKWGVVKGVDSVITGAENVNLTVWTDAQAVTEAENSSTPNVSLSGPHDPDYATKGVYTLYDDDGIVIAAVVVGEDEGSARNLVYAHTSTIESESYNGSGSSRASGDGLWTWTRKVISNGEEVVLTEVSDGNSDLVKMQQYHWYQIKTNGDGEVTGVYKLRDDERGGNLPNANLDRYDDYALDYHYYDKNGNGVQDVNEEIGEIAYTVQNGASTVLYWNEDFIKSNLSMNGRTLYVATDDQTGFIVSSNVKWVVQQWDSNKKETYIDDGTTASGLKNMIDEINRRNTINNVTEPYSYQVSAIIESGIASSVVIYFNENDYNRPGNIVTPTGDAELVWNDVDKDDQYWNLIIPAGDYHENMTTDEIDNWLSKAGCSNISKTRVGWNFTRNGMNYTDQAIVVIPKAGVTTYTVTVTAPVNGTASVDKATAAAGATVTVTATPDAGYVVDTISVNGKAITGSTFTMPAENVTVTVTFKADVTPVEGIIFAGGSAEENVDFTAVKNEDGSYTIKAVDTTLGVKVYEGEGYTVAGAGAEWTITPGADSGEITVAINKFEWTVVTDVDGNFGLKAVEVVPQSRARARVLASEPIISSRTADDGFMKISFNGIEALAGKSYVVKQETRETDNGATTAFWFGKDLTAEAAQELVAALNAAKGDFKVSATANVTPEEKEAWAGGEVEDPILPEATDSIQVLFGESKYELYTHKASVTSVSEEELYSAIIAAAKKALGATYANAEGKVTDLGRGQYVVIWSNMGDNAPNWTCDMVTTGEGTVSNPKDLFVVSVNGTAGQYVKSGSSVTLTGITGAKYLIPDTMPIAVAKADYAVSASGTLTVGTVEADVNYVPAVWMLGITNDSSQTQVKAKVDGSTAASTALADGATNGWMIPKTGCTVKFAFEEASATATKGQKVDLKANDKVIATAVVEDTTKGASFTVEAAEIVAEADKNDKIVMTRKAQANSEIQKVLVDGVEVTFDAKNEVIVLDKTKYHEAEGFIVVTMEADDATGLDAEKLYGTTTELTSLYLTADKDDGTKGHDGELIVNLSTVLSNVDSEGTLKLVAASEISLETASNHMKSMTLTVDGKVQDAINASGSKLSYYVKKGSTVTVVGEDEAAGFVVCTKSTTDPALADADDEVTLLGTFKTGTAATAKDVVIDADAVDFTYQLAAEATNEVKVTAGDTVGAITVGMSDAIDEITVGSMTKDCAVYVWVADTTSWKPCGDSDAIAAGIYKIVLSNVKLADGGQETLLLSSGKNGLTALAAGSTEGLTLAGPSSEKSTVTFDQEAKTYAMELYVTLAGGGGDDEEEEATLTGFDTATVTVEGAGKDTLGAGATWSAEWNATEKKITFTSNSDTKLNLTDLDNVSVEIKDADGVVGACTNGDFTDGDGNGAYPSFNVTVNLEGVTGTKTITTITITVTN